VSQQIVNVIEILTRHTQLLVYAIKSLVDLSTFAPDGGAEVTRWTYNTADFSLASATASLAAYRDLVPVVTFVDVRNSLYGMLVKAASYSVYRSASGPSIAGSMTVARSFLLPAPPISVGANPTIVTDFDIAASDAKKLDFTVESREFTLDGEGFHQVGDPVEETITYDFATLEGVYLEPYR
jgi:hypothetical protein